eukprot:TRINITY_DN29986_c0_g1_i2.p2 TRINITY_DN29986_c0_g1~~TRINITY_DN29986_c0_g1_i2.p2  ORF type:complete len:123 (-),score=2.21 TRINITY_DN29986_c0_g1_i2:90-458(-)
MRIIHVPDERVTAVIYRKWADGILSASQRYGQDSIGNRCRAERMEDRPEPPPIAQLSGTHKSVIKTPVPQKRSCRCGFDRVWALCCFHTPLIHGVPARFSALSPSRAVASITRADKSARIDG